MRDLRALIERVDDSEYAAYIWERSGLEFRAEAVRSSRAIALILATLRALEAQGADDERT